MKEEKEQYIGNLSQLLRVENCRLEGGKKDGVRAAYIANEKGLNFTVIADRCMDIAYVSLKGINISYINPCGIVASQYYDRTGVNWLKSFTAGFVTTCGLDNIGNPCVDRKEELGLHGKISNTPAEEYNVSIVKKDENEVHLKGIMNPSSIFGSKLQLNREIISFQETNRIIIKDEIINNGFEEEEYMQLYHFNIGYPFLSPKCEIMIPSDEIKGANAYSENNIDKWNKIEPPSKVGEMCFTHRLKKKNDMACVGMFNHEKQLGFTISFEHSNLDHFIQWRYLHQGEYVMGFEPATNEIGGKEAERKENRLKTIQPRSSLQNTIQIDFFEEKNCMKRFVEQYV